MKLHVATLAVTLLYAPISAQQTCSSGISGPFTLADLSGPCNYDTLLDAYTQQVYSAAGSCSVGSPGVSPEEDLNAKLIAATAASSGLDGARIVCDAMYDAAEKIPFNKAADKNTETPDDLHFEQQFYNGRGDWVEEVETIYESSDRTATSELDIDAAKVREFYLGDGSYSRVTWPSSLTNFDDSTCESHAAMCCWPKDRQANDGNGNCATPYDEDCVDKDPADNTNLCFTDLTKGNMSTNFDSDKGFVVFPEDNGNNDDTPGEGAIHCHGFAWADDEYHHTARYKANNLFYVSMYDHMHQRGYVENIPGAPMCGCIEQMPTVTRSDCTQIDLTEVWRMDFDGTAFTGHIEKVDIDFNACKGRRNDNNDLWAYAARLYDEGTMTRHQFGAVGRVLTEHQNHDNSCYHATEFEKAKKGYVTGYNHDETKYTKVAGRDNMKDGEPFGREAFNTAFFEQSSTKATPILYRICPDCTKSHQKIWYRRLTSIDDDNFDLLHHLLYYSEDNPHPDNVWGKSFTLHSSYDEAVSGDNAWHCPVDQNTGEEKFNYRKPFTGNCSPDGTQVNDQHSKWNSWPGPRPNVAYYVNMPDDNTGLHDFSDSVSIQRAVGTTDQDIGNVGLAGNTLVNNGTYHITGSGKDIWAYDDQFHYKSQPWEGDIDVKVHLTDFANNGKDGWAKAGIMLRADNGVDATYAFMMLTGSYGIDAQYRSSKGNHGRDSGDNYKTESPQKSAWLRIVKKMETIEYYRSENPEVEGWVLHSTGTIFFPMDKFRVGLAVTSHRNDHLAEATFADYEISQYNFPTSSPSISTAPTPWYPFVNIGNPQRDGEFYPSQDGSIDYVKGSGTGIWGSSDSFFFYNEQVRDKGFGLSVEMYINRFDNWDHQDTYALGGIMLRDTNDPNSANVFVGAVGRDRGVTLQSRAAAGEKTVGHGIIYVNNINKFWVKLHKLADPVGGTVKAYYKVDAEDEWILLGEVELTLSAGGNIQVGRAVTAGDDNQWALKTMYSSNYDVNVYEVA